MAYTPRLVIPEQGNPYYNTKDVGGYSDAIKGKPTEKGLNTLRNCVGYAYGRFNEIVGAGYMKYLAPVNAEQFIDYMNYREKGVTSGMKPKVGAVAVWQGGKTKNGSDGAGHVAVVEQVFSDGSIVTSESGWNASQAFWTKKRTNDNGRWGQNTNYTFLGFIYNPAVPDIAPTPVCKYVAGDIVYFIGGNDHSNSMDSGNGYNKPASLARISKVASGAKYPYHCRRINEKGAYISGGVYGWVAENTITT